jgi:hypothetical protein
MAVRDLWTGAEVRWVGPEISRDGVLLRPGDRAIVTDAGRHHVTNFSPFGSGRASRPWRRLGGVVIRSSDGTEVDVPRKHLEHVPPNHPLAPERDPEHADWWLANLAPWGTDEVAVRSFVPSQMAAVCRVFHGSGGTGELDELTATALVDVLTDATSTPDDVFIAIWEGWADVPPQRFPGAARLDTAHRGHLLLRGPLSGVQASVSAAGFRRIAAGLWWPADRAWFVATEIDHDWTFVAGEQEVIDLLAGDGRLEVVATDFDEPSSRGREPG